MTSTRARRRCPENQEQPVHPLYGYVYVTDREEGLVVVGPARTRCSTATRSTTSSKRAATFNPGGMLTRRHARSRSPAPTPTSRRRRGLVVVDLDDPLQPEVVARRRRAPACASRARVAVQFRYAFVARRGGPEGARRDASPDGAARRRRARSCRSRTRTTSTSPGPTPTSPRAATASCIVDIERPEKPRLDQIFNAGGAINDAHDVKLGITNASAFAYLADGKNGLRVVQLISPRHAGQRTASARGRRPALVATYKTHGPALALSRGLDRDRAVDETGNQLGGLRPPRRAAANREEQQRMYLRDGKLSTVREPAPGPARATRKCGLPRGREPAPSRPGVMPAHVACSRR